VLTVYHLMTIMIEQGPATKLLVTYTGRAWVKSWPPPDQQQQLQPQPRQQ